ncbi:MAG: hypothetical protein ACRDI2_05940 [Chloroflexota bacterium]
MAVNMEAAQLVVGAAILDPRFCRLLLSQRAKALAEVERQPSAPNHVRLSRQDRQALGAIRAGTLAEFARGVERLRTTVTPTPLRARPTALHAADAEARVG